MFCFNKLFTLYNKFIHYDLTQIENLNNALFLMLSLQAPSRLKLINLLIPPSNNPLLTPYTKHINPKIMPMKRQYSILSNIKQTSTKKQQPVELTKKDYFKINRSYKSLKRFKNLSFGQNQQQKGKFSDTQYIRLISLRKQMIRNKNRLQQKQKQKQNSNNIHYSKTSANLLNKDLNFLSMTQPVITSRLKQNKIHTHKLKRSRYSNSFQQASNQTGKFFQSFRQINHRKNIWK